MGRRLTLTETLLQSMACPRRFDPASSWEVGRLVLLPEYRSDPETLKQCLHLSLRYLCTHTPARDLFAACTHVLGRLYRRYGFTAFAKDIALPGTEKSYTLIHGDGADVLSVLAQSTCGSGRDIH